MLPDEKKKIYRLIQRTHIHGSPDGPWFFIVARNDVKNKAWQLLGITDTSMLRPQVFAIQEGPVKIGVIASERQAINAVLLQKDPRTREPSGFYEYIRAALRDAGFQYVTQVLEELKRLALKGQESRRFAIQALTLLYDRVYETGNKKRSSLLQLCYGALNEIFSSVPLSNYDLYTRLDWNNRSRLGHPGPDSQVLVVDATDFPVEGDESAARFLVEAYNEGWKNVLLYNLRGHRFIGSGLGPRTNGLRIDCYGDVGDYVASGIDGCEV